MQYVSSSARVPPAGPTFPSRAAPLEDVSGLSVPELKGRLREAGLSTVGNKSQLQCRLQVSWSGRLEAASIVFFKFCLSRSSRVL